MSDDLLFVPTYRRGDPGFDEASAMTERMWAATAGPTEKVNIYLVLNAVILLIVKLVGSHWKEESRERVVYGIAQSAIASLLNVRRTQGTPLKPYNTSQR